MRKNTDRQNKILKRVQIRTETEKGTVYFRSQKKGRIKPQQGTDNQQILRLS